MGPEDPGPAQTDATPAGLTALLDEDHLHIRGSPVGRRVGLALLLAGVLLALADRRLVQVGAANWIAGTDVTLLSIGVGLVVIGTLAALLFVFVPGRRPAVPLATADEDQVRKNLRANRGLAVAGWSLVGVAAVVAFYGVTIAAPATTLLAVAAAAVLAAVAVPLLVTSAARAPVLRRLLAEVLVHAHTPVGPDLRVAPVLRTLDELLGALSDDHVRAFMQSPEASLYLELMEEALAAPEEPPSASPPEHAPPDPAPAAHSVPRAAPPPAPLAPAPAPEPAPESAAEPSAEPSAKPAAEPAILDEPGDHDSADEKPDGGSNGPTAAPPEANGNGWIEVPDPDEHEAPGAASEEGAHGIQETDRDGPDEPFKSHDADATDEASEIAARMRPGRTPPEEADA